MIVIVTCVTQSLLSFLPPSCVVVLIRELANIHSFTLASSSKSSTMATLLSNMNIDIDIDIIKRKSIFFSKINLRKSSILSNTLSVSYYEKIEHNNNLPDKEIWDLVNSFQLLYKKNVKVGKSVRIAIIFLKKVHNIFQMRC